MSVCKVLVHHLRSQVFSHVVASLCGISWPSQNVGHIPGFARRTLEGQPVKTNRSSQSVGASLHQLCGSPDFLILMIV